MDNELQAVKQSASQEETLPMSPEAVQQLWPLPPSQRTLHSGEAHVWSALLEQPKERTEDLAAALSAEEKRKADQFRFENIRQKWVVGRGLLRQILGCYSGRDASEVCFEYGANGKPVFASQGPALHFNFSHSGTWRSAPYPARCRWEWMLKTSVSCRKPLRFFEWSCRSKGDLLRDPLHFQYSRRFSL